GTDTAAWQPTTDPSLRPVIDLMLGTSVPLIRYLRNELGFKSDLLYQGPFGEGYPGSTAFRGDWMSTKWGRGNAQGNAPAPPPPPARCSATPRTLDIFPSATTTPATCTATCTSSPTRSTEPPASARGPSPSYGTVAPARTRASCTCSASVPSASPRPLDPCRAS